MARSPINKSLNHGIGGKIGDDCEIYGTAIFGSDPYLVEIGNHVRINDRVNFATHDGGVWVLRHMSTLPNYEKIDLFGRIKVGNNVRIGTGATIMPGVTIGNNCIIGCGSIITKNVPDNSAVVGIPERIIEDIWEYEAKNKNDFD